MQVMEIQENFHAVVAAVSVAILVAADVPGG
jgi:hypothetical protein